MGGMESRPPRDRVRKLPEERRREIITTAADLAVAQGLERITLRSVAERLSVRPGLISHYFPVAEDLVAAAFARAAETEREQFFLTDGDALHRLAHFVGRIERAETGSLAKLWLNARHLARFSPALEAALEEQDKLDREQLSSIIAEGVVSGEWSAVDVDTATIRIIVAVDGTGAYINTGTGADHPAHRSFVADVAAWALGIEPNRFREAIVRDSLTLNAAEV